MFSLAYTGSNLKITETVRDLRRVPSVPHTLQGSPAKYLKAISPESICPMYGTDSGIRHLCKTALTHIRQSIALRKCSVTEAEAKRSNSFICFINMDNLKFTQYLYKKT